VSVPTPTPAPRGNFDTVFDQFAPVTLAPPEAPPELGYDAFGNPTGFPAPPAPVAPEAGKDQAQAPQNNQGLMTNVGYSFTTPTPTISIAPTDPDAPMGAVMDMATIGEEGAGVGGFGAGATAVGNTAGTGDFGGGIGFGGLGAGPGAGGTGSVGTTGGTGTATQGAPGAGVDGFGAGATSAVGFGQGYGYGSVADAAAAQAAANVAAAQATATATNE
jgi:hypothetical protein